MQIVNTQDAATLLPIINNHVTLVPSFTLNQKKISLINGLPTMALAVCPISVAIQK